MTGWKLDAARDALAGSTPDRSTPDRSTPGPALRVVETSAPPRKNVAHVFGDWRVLRVRRVPGEGAEPVVELTVARELLEHAQHKA